MMMDLSGDMPVTLVIKAPNQRMADQTVDCMLGWTIKKLKQHLETVYPSKPKHNEQRLIYSGRLLQDHLTLKEILRQYDDAEFSNKHTVHLVCSSASDSSTSSSSSSSLPAKNGNGNVSQPATSSPSQGNPPSSENRNSTETMVTNQGEGLRYRGQGQPPDLPTTPVTTSTYTAYPMYQPPAAMGGDTAAGYPGYPVSPEQYAWMMHQQQVYSQYMMQYMQYYQSHYNPGQSFNPQMPPSPFLQQPLGGASLPPPLQQQPQQQPQAQPAAAANDNGGGGGGAGAARQNVRMNAQGGMEEDDDDEGEPRDWLHHTYFFMRFLTFMGILFFYSNLTRFLIVFTGSFAIYFLQKLRKYMQRAQREQEQQQQQQQEQNQQQQNEQEDQQQPQSENSSEESQDPERRNSEENPVPDTETADNNLQQQEPEDDQGRITRTFMFICNTIQTFFTSLLPTPPELLEAN